MKSSYRAICFGLFLTLAAVSLSGCGVINGIRAKNAINEGALAYKQNKFPVAQQRFEDALSFDPTIKNGKFFRARAIHAQYKPGVDTPENVAKARKAIEAYQDVLNSDPDNDEASKAIVFLYGSIREEEQQRQWLTRRANAENVPKEARAQALVVLASQKWKCSFDITEPAKITTADYKIQYKKLTNQADADKAQQCISEGMQLTEQAISFDPNSADAWSYKTSLLREQAKFAEMNGNAEQKAQLDKQAEEAQKKTDELSAIVRKKKEEEEQKKKQKEKKGK